MKRKVLTITLVALCLFTLSSCESNAEKGYKTMKKVSEEYINDLNKARSEEEYRRLRKEYKERVKFELGKLTEQEIKEFERKASWEKYKEAKDIENRVKEAERKAKDKKYDAYKGRLYYYLK